MIIFYIIYWKSIHYFKFIRWTILKYKFISFVFFWHEVFFFLFLVQWCVFLSAIMSIKSHYIITGPPSSGKTSIINHLENLGYCCFPEIARRVIKENRMSNLNCFGMYCLSKNLFGNKNGNLIKMYFEFIVFWMLSSALFFCIV